MVQHFLAHKKKLLLNGVEIQVEATTFTPKVFTPGDTKKSKDINIVNYSLQPNHQFDALAENKPRVSTARVHLLKIPSQNRFPISPTNRSVMTPQFINYIPPSSTPNPCTRQSASKELISPPVTEGSADEYGQVGTSKANGFGCMSHANTPFHCQTITPQFHRQQAYQNNAGQTAYSQPNQAFMSAMQYDPRIQRPVYETPASSPNYNLQHATLLPGTSNHTSTPESYSLVPAIYSAPNYVPQTPYYATPNYSSFASVSSSTLFTPVSTSTSFASVSNSSPFAPESSNTSFASVSNSTSFAPVSSVTSVSNRTTFAPVSNSMPCTKSEPSFKPIWKARLPACKM
jgi:hypothetical protein